MAIGPMQTDYGLFVILGRGSMHVEKWLGGVQMNIVPLQGSEFAAA